MKKIRIRDPGFKKKFGFGIKIPDPQYCFFLSQLVCFFLFFFYFFSQANGLSVRNELLSFHSKWYSSNIMSMAILGQQVGQILLYDNNLYQWFFVVDAVLDYVWVRLKGDFLGCLDIEKSIFYPHRKCTVVQQTTPRILIAAA
jgi:hypothetical protein